MVFDVFDGLIARMTNSISRFGMEFDSLADLVSFGVAPAVMVYRISLSLYDSSPMRSIGHIGFFICAVYAGCAALRLARFNSRIEDESKSFSGVPTPAAAGVIAGYVLLVNTRNFPLGLATFLNQYYLPLATAALGLLMVSTIRYPAPAKQDLWRKQPFLYLPIAILVIMLVFASKGPSLCFAFTAYVVYGLVMHFRNRRAPLSPDTAPDHAPVAPPPKPTDSPQP